jgi:hypothetical protein
MKKEEFQSFISELSNEINATQRAIAALQKTSANILDKLDKILQDRDRRNQHVETGY